MIQFACHTWAFTDLTLPEALGTIARLGFRYVDIGSGQNLNAARTAQNPRREAGQVRADLAMFNLQVSDVYLLLPRISLADDEQRQRDIDIFKALLPFVKVVGAPGITVSPGIQQPEDDETGLKRTSDALREMLTLARDHDLRLSIEPHLDSMAQTPDAALQLIGIVDGLEITLDWAQMVCQGIKTRDILALLPHTRHVQIRQAARNRLQTTAARGRIDVAEVMHALKEAEYDGVVSVEYMNIEGRHGMMTVDPVLESATLRDALRTARDAKKNV